MLCVWQLVPSILLAAEEIEIFKTQSLHNRSSISWGAHKRHTNNMRNEMKDDTERDT